MIKISKLWGDKALAIWQKSGGRMMQLFVFKLKTMNKDYFLQISFMAW